MKRMNELGWALNQEATKEMLKFYGPICVSSMFARVEYENKSSDSGCENMTDNCGSMVIDIEKAHYNIKDLWRRPEWQTLNRPWHSFHLTLSSVYAVSSPSFLHFRSCEENFIKCFQNTVKLSPIFLWQLSLCLVVLAVSAAKETTKERKKDKRSSLLGYGAFPADIGVQPAPLPIQPFVPQVPVSISHLFCWLHLMLNYKQQHMTTQSTLIIYNENRFRSWSIAHIKRR